MNIAVLHFHRLGGSGIVAYELGLAMASSKGHHVHFVGLKPPFRFQKDIPNLHYHQITMQEYPVFDFQPYALALSSQLVDLSLKADIDIIHSHYAIPHAISALLVKNMLIRQHQKNIKCITTLHGTDITIVGSHPTMKHITRYAIEASDAVVAVSRSLRADTEKQFYIRPGFIRVAYNFIRSDRYPKPNPVPIDKRAPLIFFHSSNLREAKNPMDVITIFHAVQKKVSLPCELHIAGEGPLYTEMYQKSITLGLESKAKFLGVVKDLTMFLSKASFYLSTSQHEAFGLSALEAMACGVVVVSSRVGGVPEVVKDGENGLLFTCGDTKEASDKLTKLLSQPEAYMALSKAACRTAHEGFQMQDAVDLYDDLYRSDRNK